MAGFAYYVIQRNDTINDSILICRMAIDNVGDLLLSAVNQRGPSTRSGGSSTRTPPPPARELSGNGPEKRQVCVLCFLCVVCFGPGSSPCWPSGHLVLPAIAVRQGLTWGGCKHTCIGPTLIAIAIPIPLDAIVSEMSSHSLKGRVQQIFFFYFMYDWPLVLASMHT